MFTVIAGKYDGNELNCKYSEDFETLDKAIAAHDEMSTYPWALIEYKGRVLDVYYKGFKALE
jgi:hypothetical protein